MCGFVAIVSKNKFTNTDQVKHKLTAMTDILKHRGPDAQGFFYNDWLALGFNRLAIIDLKERANQPMFDENDRFVLIYNGEIYNYLKIRDELTNLGHLFRTTSDSEVVLKSFIQWREKCIDKFLGMFSFIIVDLLENRLFSFRDQFGIKPLYYTETNDSYIFTSEIKALKPLVKFKANTAAIYEYLVFRYSIEDETLFKDVCRLQPGCFIDYKRGTQIRTKQYFKIQNSFKDCMQPANEEEEIDDIEKIFSDGVALHTMSDVEYGTQLSGGVDSSLVTKYVSDVHKGRLHTFSVSFAEKTFDESIFQKEVSSKVDSLHHNLLLTEDTFAENIMKCIKHYDFPLHDANNIPFYLLCQMASSMGIKVLISGDGADEICHGYSRYIGLGHYSKTLKAKIRTMYANSIIPHILEKLLSNKLPQRLSDEHPIIHRTVRNNPYQVHILVPELEKNIDKRRSLYWEMRKSPESALAVQDFCGYLRPWLTRGDRMAMAASVELRVPFCNIKLLEKMNSLPFEFKLKENIPKYPLKKIANKYFSDNLVWRRKIGFGLPLDNWFRNKKGLGSHIETLSDKKTTERGIFESKTLRKIINDHLEQKKNYGMLLWNVLNIELWFRIFIDENSW